MRRPHLTLPGMLTISGAALLFAALLFGWYSLGLAARPDGPPAAVGPARVVVTGTATPQNCSARFTQFPSPNPNLINSLRAVKFASCRGYLPYPRSGCPSVIVVQPTEYRRTYYPSIGSVNAGWPWPFLHLPGVLLSLH